ncbi:hypothetical protein E6P09_13260 [Haloferax mediterranei ATCC 33500]|uniref:Uncharacterized protein n=1 Tax=Haloferax mediterranei (strain ATCC 33500 / DSM 1411 / JCM 8866 / NBRC 14739 / NCIMB 2177 / R-4) TaxID=523841 RepID=I3R822_HALMT|nr:hypothetical protein [Haloferax mediterranei]AFK20382.1 hypothetical protein HFX_2704 [Haloferax mediterranei ATCC 33500]AHZ23747.1 hypothetical protein BM92_14330 [Haloferax mediterranei ATCC 33500]ELZ99237.1 hypothetical protein C439_15299 [Haloferax mediterranei ATCC 33500]MDX5986863.1 hypothetical protein [Haloferax mediterranei ATCC 33500]QCQ76187.1 hypothetical protein E6P09_13260 [Haloferax mediterranei ATCC 33500]
MVTEIGLFYLVGMTVLFFFWAYGIVSFVLDLKNKFIPKGRQYLRGRRRLKEEQKREKERQEREEQLY